MRRQLHRTGKHALRLRTRRDKKTRPMSRPDPTALAETVVGDQYGNTPSKQGPAKLTQVCLSCLLETYLVLPSSRLKTRSIGLDIDMATPYSVERK